MYNNKKIFLNTNYNELKRKMNDSKSVIEVEVSSLIIDKRATFRKDNISRYGEAGI